MLKCDILCKPQIFYYCSFVFSDSSYNIYWKSFNNLSCETNIKLFVSKSFQCCGLQENDKFMHGK